MVRNTSVKIALLNYITLIITVIALEFSLLGTHSYLGILLYIVVAYTFLTIFTAPIGVVMASVEKSRAGLEEGAKIGLAANLLYFLFLLAATIFLWPEIDAK
ncbi:MAG: hypothetical protein L3J42_06130 [Hydrogenimonas sp.]|nr:hypothetical protein [Hydrogenimonas sp.]